MEKYFELYLHGKTELQKGRIKKQLIEKIKLFNGRRFYNMVELYLPTIEVKQIEFETSRKVRGERIGSTKKEYCLYPEKGVNRFFTITKTEYDYIQWRLQQVEKEKQEVL